MSFKTKPILDSNNEFIYFTGKISKHIFSKNNDNMIGVNINDLKVYDKFYKDECLQLIKKLQNKNVKLYKKEIPRPYLVLFAPKAVNKDLSVNKYPIGTYVKFIVEQGHKIVKDKKDQIFNVTNLEVDTSHKKNIEKKYGTGIFINSKFTPIDELSFKSPILISLLDKVYDNNTGDIDHILNLNTLINKWLSKGIEHQKKQEYEIERKKLESKKKDEVKQTSEALVKALQSVKTIYNETISQQ
tara:strand:+ start:530 stop:1258 length:729 start_codon:yes stop_codon:yes gene_type:complete